MFLLCTARPTGSLSLFTVADSIHAYGVLQLAGTQPPRAYVSIIRALSPGAKLDDIQLDAAIRQKTIDAVSAKLNEYYVYPDVAAKMVQAIQDHQKHGDYNSLMDGSEFALRSRATCERSATINTSVVITTHSSYPSSPTLPPGRTSQRRRPAQFRTMMEQQNCTFSKVEILSSTSATSSSAPFRRRISARLL